MQENKEYHRTGITEAIAEDAIHIMEGDEAIIHDPPESHRLSKTQHTFLTVRNIFVVIAGGLFILSMLHIEPIYHYWNVLKFVAYILGAGAYGAEVIVLTDGWGSVTFWEITDKTNNGKGRITVRGLSAGWADGHFFAKK